MNILTIQEARDRFPQAVGSIEAEIGCAVEEAWEVHDFFALVEGELIFGNTLDRMADLWNLRNWEEVDIVQELDLDWDDFLDAIT